MSPSASTPFDAVPAAHALSPATPLMTTSLWARNRSDCQTSAHHRASSRRSRWLEKTRANPKKSAQSLQYARNDLSTDASTCWSRGQKLHLSQPAAEERTASCNSIETARTAPRRFSSRRIGAKQRARRAETRLQPTHCKHCTLQALHCSAARIDAPRCSAPSHCSF